MPIGKFLSQQVELQRSLSGPLPPEHGTDYWDRTVEVLPLARPVFCPGLQWSGTTPDRLLVGIFCLSMIGHAVGLQDYLRTIRRRWLLILVTTIVTLGLSATWTFTQVPQYSSTAKLFVSTSQSDTSDSYQGALLSAQRVTSYAQQVSTNQLANTVLADLNLNVTASKLAEKVSARVIPDTVVISITAQDASPQMSQLIAQTYAEDLTDWIREIETPPGATVPPLKASISDPATLPDGPSSPNPPRNLALGLLLGLLVGIGLAVARDMLDTSVKTPADIGEVSSAPLLGTIAYDSSARARPLVTALESHAPRVESFRVLRTNLQFVDVDSQEKVFVVTSAVPEEGKTTTAVNLAVTLSQAGVRTLLVEGDLRRPRATLALSMDQSVGVTTVLLGKVTLDDAIQKHAGTDLHVLGSGAIPPNPAELLQSNAMADLLRQLRRLYDVVIIDAPPLLPVTDAALLASQSDGALLVVRWGKTSTDQLAQAVERLEQVGAAPVGIVFNMVPLNRRRGGTNGYGYGYGYGYAPVVDTGTKLKKN